MKTEPNKLSKIPICATRKVLKPKQMPDGSHDPSLKSLLANSDYVKILNYGATLFEGCDSSELFCVGLQKRGIWNGGLDEKKDFRVESENADFGMHNQLKL